MIHRPVYDAIGANYRSTRKEDPRLARLVTEALGDAGSVVNVGAGPGSYEPRDRRVFAVEPSLTMIRQRPVGAAPVVQGVAEKLPLRDDSVDASLAILTIHHWSNQDVGLSELCRVARDRAVILTWDPDSTGFWLVEDYFPEFVTRDRDRCPTISSLAERLVDPHVVEVPIPHDCQDGFLGAFWRRPRAYLDAAVRSGISSFSQGTDLSPLLDLERDLDAGRWDEKHARIKKADELDLGYRLIYGRPGD